MQPEDINVLRPKQKFVNICFRPHGGYLLGTAWYNTVHVNGGHATAQCSSEWEPAVGDPCSVAYSWEGYVAGVACGEVYDYSKVDSPDLS